MTLTAQFLIAIWAIPTMGLIYAMLTAPRGYQDASGFHEGEPSDDSAHETAHGDSFPHTIISGRNPPRPMCADRTSSVRPVGVSSHNLHSVSKARKAQDDHAA